MSDRVIIFAQLGSPKSPSTGDVRSYLKEFLSNPLVVPLNRFLWKLVLNFFVLPFRSPKSARRYEKIWNGTEFLLQVISEKFVAKIKERGVNAELAYVLGEKNFKDVLIRNRGKEITVIPMFPQHCKSTTGLVEEIIGDQKVDLVRSFHIEDFYIESCVRRIKEEIGDLDSLIISFHSAPVKGNEEYIRQCVETYSQIADQLDLKDIRLGFQSKFGKGEWIGPLLEDLVDKEERVAIFCPGFLVDCLETTLEVGVELKENFPGIKYIEALNDHDEWVDAFADWVKKSRA